MSVNEPRITLVVDRYETMDAIAINFTLPAGTLTGQRSSEVAAEVQKFIADIGFVKGQVISHHGVRREE
jgi:type IV pilus biogenesis protein CpaD/CtpE